MLGLVADYSDEEDDDERCGGAGEQPQAHEQEKEQEAEELQPPPKKRCEESAEVLPELPVLRFDSSDSSDDDDDKLLGPSLFDCGAEAAPNTGKGYYDEEEEGEGTKARARTKQKQSKEEQGSSGGFAAILPKPKHEAVPLPCPQPAEEGPVAGVSGPGAAVVYSSSAEARRQKAARAQQVLEVAAEDVAAARTHEEAMLEHAPAFVPTIAAPESGSMRASFSARNKNQLSIIAAQAHDVEQELALKRYNSGKNKAQSRAKYGW